MDARMWRNGAAFASLALSVLALTALPSAARQQQQDPAQQSTGDPVADAARKAREQKKKDTPKPKKVYTDDDLNHLVTGTAAPSGDANAPGTTQEGAAKNSDAQGKDAAGKTGEHAERVEATWGKQVRESDKKVGRAAKRSHILKREEKQATRNA